MESSSGSNQQNGATEQRRSNPRPESTMALEFSSALDGAFNLDDNILQLGSQVQEKKETVTEKSQELQQLEARLKATEERLKKAGVQSPASSGQQEMTSATGHAVKAAPSTSSTQPPPSRAPPGRPGALAAASSSVADRVPTPLDPRREAMPGDFPETPSGQQQAADYYDQRRS